MVQLAPETTRRRPPAGPGPDAAAARDDLVARAAALQPSLWEDAAESDRTRRLTDRGIGQITEAGLMRLMTPRRFGGYEADVRTVLDVTTALGRGCTSSAWVTGVLNSGNFVAGLFPDQARAEVWASGPDTRTALVLVPPAGAAAAPAADGLTVTGKWGYASGSLHCEWIALMVPVDTGSARPDMRLALLPMSDVQVEDTWKVIGMRGTGSNTVVADQVFVPGHRLLPLPALLEGERPHQRTGEPLYRSSVSGVLQVFLLGSMIGACQAALAYVLEKAPRRSIAASTYAHQTDSAPFTVDVAEAAATIDTAQLHAQRLAETVDQHARSGDGQDVPDRARMRMDAAHTVQSCREAVDLLLTAHGASAFAEVSPLQRIWRDIGLGSRHGGFGSRIPQEVYGRALLGQDPRQTSYLL